MGAVALTWSMLKNTGCMIQYWKPAPRTARICTRAGGQHGHRMAHRHFAPSSLPAALCPACSIIRNAACILSPHTSPCSRAVSRMPPMADMRMATTSASFWVEMPMNE